jgi:hypothetical protein
MPYFVGPSLNVSVRERETEKGIRGESLTRIKKN